MPFLMLLLVSASLHAATIEVRIERAGYPGPLSMHLGTPAADHEPQWITSRTVETEPIRFEGLASGTYVVALSGSAPMERLTQKLNLGSDDERVLRITVPKRRLAGRLTIGGKPLPNAGVTLMNDAWNWSAHLTADATGTFTAPLWDEGEYVVDLRDGALTAPVKTLATLHGDAKLDVALPDRHIRGRVVDTDGRPIAGAKVLLRGEREGLRAILAVLTTKDGTFDYPGVEPGPHTIRINRDGYLIADEIAVDVLETDTLIERKVTLTPGIAHDLVIVDAHDQPVGNAVVLASSGGRVRALANTGSDGHVRIATPHDERCTLWVLPDSGSLAALELDRERTRVVVPEATASLDVQTLLSDGSPLSNVSFVLRYNGELAPPDVGRMLGRGGNRLSTNADGVAQLAHIPAGTYELWPYVTDAEADALIAAAAPSKAPVSVNVTTGRQTAVVRFEKSN